MDMDEISALVQAVPYYFTPFEPFEFDDGRRESVCALCI